MTATLSIRGLYIVNETLFSDMVMPDGMDASDRDIIVDNILNEYAELEVIYPDPVFMKDAIGKWSRKEVPTWQRIFNAAKADYNPIENYNRTEESEETGSSSGKETHSGKDTSTTDSRSNLAGMDKDANSGSDSLTTNRAAFDSNSLVTTGTDTTQHGHILTKSLNETTTESGTASVNHGEIIDNSGNNNLVRRSHIAGNIGVTTSQQMLEQEIIVSAKLNVYNYIMNSFKDSFCLEVY